MVKDRPETDVTLIESNLEKKKCMQYGDEKEEERRWNGLWTLQLKQKRMVEMLSNASSDASALPSEKEAGWYPVI